jgi:hypothetical protein
VSGALHLPLRRALSPRFSAAAVDSERVRDGTRPGGVCGSAAAPDLESSERGMIPKVATAIEKTGRKMLKGVSALGIVVKEIDSSN